MKDVLILAQPTIFQMSSVSLAASTILFYPGIYTIAVYPVRGFVGLSSLGQGNHPCGVQYLVLQHHGLDLLEHMLMDRFLWDLSIFLGLNIRFKTSLPLVGILPQIFSQARTLSSPLTLHSTHAQ